MHREDQSAAGNLQEGMKDEHLRDHCCDDSRSSQTRTLSALWGQEQGLRVPRRHCFPAIWMRYRSPKGQGWRGFRV